MGHTIVFNKIFSDAMLLEQIVSGSRSYIEALYSSYSNDKEYDYEITELDFSYDEYLSWLYENVSSLLIQCATKTRIYKDTYSPDEEPDEGEAFYSSDIEAYEHFPNIVEVISGKFRHSLRECCNKIIHAEDFELELVSNESTKKYWSGFCVLKGTFNQYNWSIKLDVRKFCMAIRYYYEVEKTL
ncbi:hypothetical protein [Vibrio fujianensis]|uniref:hypothetical protein n=1 Tax=Vibrio fujianensis TaxID=1974215 RepID=UPI0013000950|nr:hypothetical protein [Vibrio fujianensis]